MSDFVVGEKVRFVKDFFVGDWMGAVDAGEAALVGPRKMPGVHVVLSDRTELYVPAESLAKDSPVEEILALARGLSQANRTALFARIGDLLCADGYLKRVEFDRTTLRPYKDCRPRYAITVDPAEVGRDKTVSFTMMCKDNWVEFPAQAKGILEDKDWPMPEDATVEPSCMKQTADPEPTERTEGDDLLDFFKGS